MEKELIKPSASSTTIISSSDGPTSVFLLKNEHKPNIKHRIQKKVFALRKKWYALWIKPNPHTMQEVADYIREKYDFVELPKESRNIKDYITSLEVLLSCSMNHIFWGNTQFFQNYEVKMKKK